MPNQVTPVNFLAGSNPGLAAQQANLQVQQAIAQQMMSGSQQPDPTRSAGQFVVKESPLEGLTHAGSALASAMMQKGINQRQADLQNQQMQSLISLLRGGSQGGGSQQAVQNPEAVGDPNQPAPQSPQGAEPLSATGDPQKDLGLIIAPQLFGQTYGNVLAEKYKPGAGMINVRPGGTVYNSQTGRPDFYAPQLPAGSAPINPQNPTQGVQPIPGAIPITAATAGATTGAQEQARFPYSEQTDPQGRKVPAFTIPGLNPPSPVTQGSPAASPFPPVRRLGQTTAERAAQESNEKQLAEEASKGREAANIAVDTNYNLQHVLQSAQGFDTGKFAPTFMGARAYLQGSLPNLFPEEEMNKLKDFQELQKYSIRLGFDQARKMGARESTQIVQMSIDSNPNPQMVRPAIEAIGHGLMAQNDYVIAKEKARDTWAGSHNGTLAGFNSNWQNTADPRAFLLKYQTPQEQAKLFSTMSSTEKQKLLQGLQTMRSQGIL